MRVSSSLAPLLFLAGLALKGLCGWLFYDQVEVAAQYIEFSRFALYGLPWDPWGTWHQAGGEIWVFPYGVGMILALSPAVLLSSLGVPDEVALLLLYGVYDFFIFKLMRAFPAKNAFAAAYTFWISPISFIAVYMFGFNDLILALFVLSFLYFVRFKKHVCAVTFLTLAINIKIALIIVLPFYLIFIVRRPLQEMKSRRSVGVVLLLSVAMTLGPMYVSPTLFEAITQNREISGLTVLSIPGVDGLQLFLLPAAYFFFLLAFWRVRRPNIDLLTSIVAAVLLIFSVASPYGPGWLLWSTPLLFLLVYDQSVRHRWLSLLFVSLGAVNLIFTRAPSMMSGLAPSAQSELTHASLYSGFFVLGVYLVFKILQSLFYQSSYYQFSKTPYCVGISGDSGVGKDTLVSALQEILGERNVSHLSGDDYHRWDRRRPNWNFTTHLNPVANDLDAWSDDLFRLRSGSSTYVRHYDHELGVYSRPDNFVKSSDFIIASGLHALYHPGLRSQFDLRVYLSMDEELRRELKLERDTGVRGHSTERVLASIERRMPDAKKFILPQAENADIAFNLFATEGSRGSARQFGLDVFISDTSNIMNLRNYIVAFTGSAVEAFYDDSGGIRIRTTAQPTRSDCTVIAKKAFPLLGDFLQDNFTLERGSLGLMQVIILNAIHNSLSRS